MTIWKSVPLIIKRKGAHVRKAGGRVLGGFHRDYGDVPVARFNDVTKKFEPVVNNRGYAYALRGALRHRAAK